jgi:hypothetical protein
MSTSVEENPGFCWKCQALLNTQYPEGLIVTETEETRREPNKKQLRTIKTSDSLEATASSGCLLCLHLLHSLSIPRRTCLRRLTGVAEGVTLSPDIEYEECVFLSEGHPPSISLHVKPNRPIPELESGNEIKTLIQFFPEAGTSQQSNSLRVAMVSNECLRNNTLCQSRGNPWQHKFRYKQVNYSQLARSMCEDTQNLHSPSGQGNNSSIPCH